MPIAEVGGATLRAPPRGVEEEATMTTRGRGPAARRAEAAVAVGAARGLTAKEGEDERNAAIVGVVTVTNFFQSIAHNAATHPARNTPR